MKYSEAGGHLSYRVHSCMPKKFRAVSLRSICDENYTVVATSNTAVNDVPVGKFWMKFRETRLSFKCTPQLSIFTSAGILDNPAGQYPAHRIREKPLTYFTTCRDFTDLEVVRIHSTTQLGCSSEKSESVLVCVGTVSILTELLDRRCWKSEQTSSHCLTCNRSEKLYGSNSQANYETTSKKGWKVVDCSVAWSWSPVCRLIRLFILCDSEDVGTEHVNEFEQRVKYGDGTLAFKRQTPYLTCFATRGGSGLVPEIVRVLPKLIEKAWTIASECSCPDGCPACIQSSGCSEYNHVLDKQGSLQVLDYLHSVPTI
ncbi:putative DEAD/DEAH-box helicase [Phytophthora cactorum]|nr:putative DEAD/DEAH-box helicase [Phytophthora cactorum]